MNKRQESEIVTLQRWLDSAESDRAFGGYPLGRAYLDERREELCYGYTQGESHISVDADVARRQPHMVGKTRREVADRIYELTGGKT